MVGKAVGGESSLQQIVVSERIPRLDAGKQRTGVEGVAIVDKGAVLAVVKKSAASFKTCWPVADVAVDRVAGKVKWKAQICKRPVEVRIVYVVTCVVVIRGVGSVVSVGAKDIGLYSCK